MSKTYKYQDTFNDDIALEFSNILSLKFMPTNLANLSLWLDGSDVTSMLINETDKIEEWQDKSGNNYHATQNNLTKRPTLITDNIIEKSIVNLNGNNSLNLPANLHNLFMGDSTIFIVAKQNTPALSRLLNAIINGSTKFNLFTNAAGTEISFYHNFIFSPVSQNVTTTYWNIYQARRTGNIQAIAVNDAHETATANTSDIAGITNFIIGSHISGNEGFNGNIAEIIIYARALTMTEKNAIYGYLGDKWGM